MPRAPPVMTAFWLARSMRFIVGLGAVTIVVRGTRVNAAPTKRADQTKEAAQADAPLPSELVAHPGSELGREHAPDIAAGIADGCGRAAVRVADLDGRGPKRRFAGADRAHGEREPDHNSHRFLF